MISWAITHEICPFTHLFQPVQINRRSAYFAISWAITYDFSHILSVFSFRFDPTPESFAEFKTNNFCFVTHEYWPFSSFPIRFWKCQNRWFYKLLSVRFLTILVCSTPCVKISLPNSKPMISWAITRDYRPYSCVWARRKIIMRGSNIAISCVKTHGFPTV